MLLIDTNNLYHSSLQRHDSLVDYEALMNYLIDEYSSFRHRYAYVSENEHSGSFANFLRGLNFIVTTKETDCFDVDIAIQAIRGLSDLNVDKMVICSSSKNLLSLFQLLTEQSVTVHVHGCSVPASFNKSVFARELPYKVMQNADALTR